MFQTDSFPEATEILAQAIQDPAFRHEAVAGARQRVMEYHPTRVAEQTVNYYREILSRLT